MDLNELWIGDRVKIVSSGKEGSYEGIGKGGKARVKYAEKILLVPSSNLVKADEIEEDPLDSIDLSVDQNKDVVINKVKKRSSQKFTNQIDLHIEKLDPGLEHAHPQIILDHQLEMCKQFVENAIEQKRNVVTIIHGRGKGALRKEVLHMLKNYGAVRFAVEVNNGGAQEVWFR